MFVVTFVSDITGLLTPKADNMSALQKNRDRCAGFHFFYSHTLTILTRSAVRLHSLRSLAPTAPLWLFSSLTWGQNGTESKVDEPDRREVEVAARRPAEERVVEPTAAPKHAARA